MYKFLSFFLLMPLMVSAQYYKAGKDNIGYPLTGKEAQLAKKYNTCTNSHRYNATQRRAFFPFSEAVTIRLISFREDSIPHEAIAKSNFSVDKSKVKESLLLTRNGIDSLTDILYNVGYTPIQLPFKLINPGHNCYSPRNAVLFINASGQVTEYIDLCFSCERYYLSSRKIKNTEYCEQKYDMLKAFFLKRGIKYGTILPKNDDDK